ncbi:MAG TPA: DUF2062 domain-containing protein [Phycisphaerae bacterium]|nr:DUF2062 domain-containing protein [Phycisphaerae bacterium]
MKCAVIIPVFNHAGSIERVIGEVLAVMARMPGVVELIVVDDGCTDGTGDILRRQAGITLVSHAVNQGKGRALLTGFGHAAANGCTHVLTIDADGQHCAGDLVRIYEEASAHPDDLVIGYRDLDTAGNVPARSKKGRNAATFWLRVQTGQRIPDSQCGLRAYPLSHVLAVKHRFLRYDFETEVLARMAWGGLKIRSVPVKCIYFRGAERVSHFRPVMDTLRGVRVNVYLVCRRLAPAPLRRLVAKSAAESSFGNWWRWASWREAIGEMLRAGSSNSELATAFALGIFIGLTPLYFLHSIIAIYLARRLHLNVIAAVVGSQISIPPLVPIWAMLSYGAGNLLLHGRWNVAGLSDFSRHMLPALLVGSFLVAICTATIGLFVARGVLYCVRTERVAG